MGMAGLFQRDEIEWMTSMTYQAASGAGAAAMRELVAQMAALGDSAQAPARRSRLGDPRHRPRGERVDPLARSLPKENIGHPLAGSLLPWIDKDLGNGQSREEWKAQAEANKILGREGNGRADPDGRHLRARRRRCAATARRSPSSCAERCRSTRSRACSRRATTG